MTLPADTTHKTEIIDELILDAIDLGYRNLDEVFMYVAKSYSLSSSRGFFSVVEKRFDSLRRRGLIVYNRSARVYVINEPGQ